MVELTSNLREKYNIVATEGLLIIDVARNSEAAERGLRPKQVIIKANQAKISKISELKAAINVAKKEGRHSVLLLVNAGENSRFIPLPIR